MVRGIDSFREWFAGYEEQYTIIGGTACDLLMSAEGLPFRATKDIDLVLIIEALNADFGKRLWEYIIKCQYKHMKKSTNEPQFYRFTDPGSSEFPAMIELFTRKPDFSILPEEAALTPLSIDESISSLSAILLDDDYYCFLRSGRVVIDGVSVLDASYLIPFKAKAWIDLSERRECGEHIDSRAIRKHKNDVFRLTELLSADMEILNLPESIKEDLNNFITQMEKEHIDLQKIGIPGKTKESILSNLKHVYNI